MQLACLYGFIFTICGINNMIAEYKSAMYHLVGKDKVDVFLFVNMRFYCNGLQKNVYFFLS